MTTINYTSDVDAKTGLVTVEWAGLSAGDDGQEFDCHGLQVASCHMWGTFGGNLSVRASNELTPTNFTEIFGGGGPGIQARIDGIPFMYVRSIKPFALSGISSVGVSIIFKIVR